ncbi:MAG: hypothetical protein QM765_41995 [Myxococcales bacterium]
MKAFLASRATHKPGTRLHRETVHDLLVDELLPKLRGEALADLLEACDLDALAADDAGDGYESLFGPALGACSDAKVRKRVSEALGKYARKGEKRLGKEHFTALLDRIGDAELTEFVEGEEKAEKIRNAVEKDLASRDAAAIEKRFLGIGKDIPGTIVEKLSYQFADALRRVKPGFDAQLAYLRYLLESGDRSAIPREVLLALSAMDAARFDAELETLAASPKAKAWLHDTLRTTVAQAHLDPKPPPAAVRHRLTAAAARFGGIEVEQERADEVRQVLIWALQGYDEQKTKTALALLRTVEKVSFTREQASDFAMHVAFKAEAHQFETVCAIGAELQQAGAGRDGVPAGTGAAHPLGHPEQERGDGGALPAAGAAGGEGGLGGPRLQPGLPLGAQGPQAGAARVRAARGQARQAEAALPRRLGLRPLPPGPRVPRGHQGRLAGILHARGPAPHTEPQA